MRLVAQQDGTYTVDVTFDELLALNNALTEVLHGPDSIEDWEFHSRMGVTREAANETLRALRDVFPGGGALA